MPKFELQGSSGHVADVTSDGKLKADVTGITLEGATIAVDGVNIADPTTPTQKLAINASGAAAVELTGRNAPNYQTYEIETLLNAVSVAAGAESAKVTVDQKNASMVLLAVNIDKNPWTLRTTGSPWGLLTTLSVSSLGMYPKTDNVANNYSSSTDPFMCIPIIRAGNMVTGVDITDWTKAIQFRTPTNFDVAIKNSHATDTATVTLKVIRIWRAGV